MDKFVFLGLLASVLVGCGSDKDEDRDPYPFEVEQSCYSQALTYDAAANACGSKASFGLINSRPDNYLACNAYTGIPNPGAFCKVIETEIVRAQPTVQKVTLTYGYRAQQSNDLPIGVTSKPPIVTPRPVLVSDSDNVERSFEEIALDDVFGNKGTTKTMVVTGKGPFKLVDLNDFQGEGYWLHSGSGLVISNIKIEEP